MAHSSIPTRRHIRVPGNVQGDENLLGDRRARENYSPELVSGLSAAGLPRRRWADADRSWRAHYAKHGPKLIAGARRVLASLGALILLASSPAAIATASPRQLREFRLTKLFAARRLQRRYSAQEKPHTGPASPGHAQISWNSSACVYVGDAHRCGDGQARRRACDWVLGPSPRKGVCARPGMKAMEELPDVLKRLLR